MERYTYFDSGKWRMRVGDAEYSGKETDRLAAYEDTGLEPEEIERILDSYVRGMTLRTENAQRLEIIKEIPIVRLRELAQAEKEGRIVVLPCKVGDTVYHITTCEYFPQVLDGTMYGSDGGPGTATGFYCPCELAENCPFDADDFDCNINKKKFAVFEDEVVSLCINDCEMRVELGYSGYVDVSDFGKTVFLTREAAEAALEAERGENNA